MLEGCGMVRRLTHPHPHPGHHAEKSVLLCVCGRWPEDTWNGPLLLIGKVTVIFRHLIVHSQYLPHCP